MYKARCSGRPCMYVSHLRRIRSPAAPVGLVCMSHTSALYVAPRLRYPLYVCRTYPPCTYASYTPCMHAVYAPKMLLICLVFTTHADMALVPACTPKERPSYMTWFLTSGEDSRGGSAVVRVYQALIYGIHGRHTYKAWSFRILEGSAVLCCCGREEGEREGCKGKRDRRRGGRRQKEGPDRGVSGRYTRNVTVVKC